MIIVGHRGARGLAPENTIISLQKALDHGAEMLEFDIRNTKDGIAFLHHDHTVTDPDGTHHLIATSTFAELKDHKPDLATLQDVFEHIDKNTPLYIEVKLGTDTAPVITDVQTALQNGWDRKNIMLASKSHKISKELFAAFPDHEHIVIEGWSGLIATRRARAINTKYIAMNQLFLWKPFIKPMSRRGWKLFAYTLNDPVKARRWATYGLYATVTDYPDRFKK